MEQGWENPPVKVLWNSPTLFDCYVTTVIFAVYPIFLLFLGPTVVHSLINLLINLGTWRSIWQLAWCQLREAKFAILDSFGILYADNQKLFNNMCVFGSESICVKNEKITDTKKSTWIGKQFPISKSIQSNLMQKPIFLCDPNARDLVFFSIDALENLAT